MNRQKKTKVIKSGYSLLMLLLSLVGVVFAWFISTGNGYAQDINFSTIKAYDSLVSVDGGEVYKEECEMNLVVDDIKAMSGLGYLEEGRLLLYCPYTDPFTGAPVTNADNSWFLDQDIVANKNYVEMKIIIKSDSKGKVYIAKETAAVPYDLNDSSRLSSFGSFSEDYIAAAIRMSFVEVVDGKEELRLLYAPNRNIELIPPIEGNEEIEGWEIETSSTNHEDYYYYDSQNLVKISNNILDNGAIFSDTIAESGIYAGELVKREDGNYYCEIMFRAFLEGSDRECAAALAGGKFRTNIAFRSVFE